jgi:antitoxin component YwqK of YwqJK toxin-antitoxin module
MILLIISCTDKNKVTTIRKGNEIIKGQIVNDSIFHDTIYYYDLQRNLTAKKYFTNGIQDGIAIDYYENNNPMIISNFNDGLKNGFNSFYKENGKCFYRDFYYYGLPVGPAIYYKENEVPERYFFISLENRTLVIIDYNKWVGVTNLVESLINFTSEIQQEGSQKEVSILLYLIRPPKIRLDYSVVKRLQKGNEFAFVKKVEGSLPFVRFTLPILPPGEQYDISLEIQDSILNKKTVIYKEL